MKHSIFIVLLLGLMLTSCDEVLIVDHIEGTWELQTYLRDGVDETSLIKIMNYEETYNIDGTFSRTYIDGKQEAVDEVGTFSINEEQTTLHISGVSSISDFSEANSTLSTSTVDVVIIDKTEFAYSFENGSETHEFRFTRKE